MLFSNQVLAGAVSLLRYAIGSSNWATRGHSIIFLDATWTEPRFGVICRPQWEHA
jgi:hypothetical protein